MKHYSKVILILCMLFVSTSLASAFQDVSSSLPQAGSIEQMEQDGVFTGYEDGTFQPERTLSRAELLTIIMRATKKPIKQQDHESCFQDVPVGQWFTTTVCGAVREGLIDGDVEKFFPTRTVNLAEFAKMLVIGAGMDVEEFSPESPWYAPYFKVLTDKNILPSSLSHADQKIKRKDAAWVLDRWLYEDKREGGPVFADIQPGVCSYDVKPTPLKNVNMDRVYTTWMGWYNTARKQRGRSAYTYDTALHMTATSWSETAKSRGYIDHRRPGISAYYDYKNIQQWFANKGVTFANKGGVTFTENIGWGVYSCSKADCTDDLLKSIRTTFDFFMSEERRAYRPHYDSVVSPYFKKIGLGIAVDPATKKYYLTVHYGTEVYSDIAPACGL